MSYWHRYEPTTPRNVKGGIKAQTKRGAFGQNWWAKKWIGILDGFHIDERLARGRKYARQGQVVSVDVKKGVVTGSVQGSGRRPYKVTIKIKTLPARAWKTAVPELFARPDIAASLLAGRIPEEAEGIFAKLGYSLLPSRSKDLATDCSCPDWSNPCKHAAAIYYIMAEELDRDPFLVFTMRGVDMEDLLKAANFRLEGEAAAAVSPPAEPLAADPETFWGREGPADELEMAVQIPKIDAALPKQLGSFPLWRGKEMFMPAMEETYKKASSVGMGAFLGGRGESWAGSEGADPVQKRRTRDRPVTAASRKPAREGTKRGNVRGQTPA